MKFSASTLLWTFFWCIFMGITAISIGFGALFPSMNLISKPFVCPNGRMDVVSQVYRPYPGKTVTTLTWYCTDGRTGARTEISILPMALSAGTIYGLLLFAVVFVGMLLLANRRATGVSSRIDMAGLNALVEQSKKLRGSLADDQERAERLASRTEGASQALARLKELKDLRQADLISEAEYEKKRREILKDL